MTLPSLETASGLVSPVLLDIEVRTCLKMAAAVEAPYRLLIGIAGPPGCGKSTVTKALQDALNKAAGTEISATVPMDGFHLHNAILEKRGLRDRKGAPETFDAEGFTKLLVQVKAGEAPLPVPIFSHNQDNPIPGGIILTKENRIALVEGNYLYLKTGAWKVIPSLLDRRLFLVVDREECRRRLIPRHIAAGKTESDARHHVETVDLKNYDRIQDELGPTEFISYDNN